MHGHDQHPALGLQQPSCAAAGALDEVFDGIAALQDLVEVGIEYGRIQAVSLEAATQEERAATPKYRADDREVEVDPRGDMRRVQTLFVEDEPQQEVVKMTAMARYVDDFLVLRNLVQSVDMRDLDAVVYARPQPP